MKRNLILIMILLILAMTLTACDIGDNTVKPEVELTGGDSMENAQMLAVNTKYHGTYEEGEVWFSFKTGEQEDVNYSITLENLTVESNDLLAKLYDADGNSLNPNRRSYSENWSPYVRADQSGRAVTGWINVLQPNTVYYFCLYDGSKTQYSLCIEDPTQEPVEEQTDIDPLDSEVFVPATNMDEAPLLSANTRYQTKYEAGSMWVAFKTGEQEDINYSITVDNLTTGSGDLIGNLYDAYGNRLSPDKRSYSENWGHFVRADQSGRTASGWIKTLEPDTTYFFCITGDSKAQYSIRITDPAQEAVAEERPAAADAEEYQTAANMDEAPLLTADTRYHGKYTGGNLWVAFKTGEQEDVNYSITLENLTTDSDDLIGNLYDAYGNRLSPDKRSYSENWGHFVRADQNGRSASGWIKTLEPDTTYFFCITGGNKAEYILMISDPNAEGSIAADPSSVKSNVDQNADIVPGTSQSSAVTLPLGTRVHGKYVNGYAWFAFTTTDAEDQQYFVTTVNRSVGSDSLLSHLYDEYGSEILPSKRSYSEVWGRLTTADQSGTAVTGRFDELKPNTTYYIRMNGDSKAYYSMKVSSPAQMQTAYKTSSSFEEAIAPLGENDEFYVGTNQNDATMLRTNVRYYGNYQDGFAWVAFTTGKQEDAEYSVTLENQKPGSSSLIANLYDEYGYKVLPDRRSYQEVWERYVTADQNGTAVTGWTSKLKPETTYYIRLEGGSKADYMLLIGEPVPQQEGNTIAEEPETPEEEVVFEVPFELNETQVRFVADEATFIDETAAKEALAPVAEVILAHPDHPILLAGTTATFGDQTACVRLSNARADAVKNMLVNEFGVPADQLKTVGLGYKDDPFERGRDVDAYGNFVRTEAAKNRRVIVLDAESDIAKEILGE